MTTARDLLERLRASPRVSAMLKCDLEAFLECVAEASRGRAESAARRSAERWQVNHELVRQAIGAAPLDYRLDGLVAVVSRRLKGRLRRRAIRSHLQALRKEVGATEPKRQRGGATVLAPSPPHAGDARS